MVQYDVKCPKRGHENKDLYLEEKRGGWFICENCKHEHQVPRFRDLARIPVLTGQQLAAKLGR